MNDDFDVFVSLPNKELCEAMNAENRDKLIVRAAVNLTIKVLVFWNGLDEKYILDLTHFEDNPAVPKPKFKKLYLTDHGQTVGFGKKYEAAADYCFKAATKVNGTLQTKEAR